MERYCQSDSTVAYAYQREKDRESDIERYFLLKITKPKLKTFSASDLTRFLLIELRFVLLCWQMSP